VDLGGAARLFACQALWRVGIPAAGRALVSALGSSDEDLRTMAGMFLVKSRGKATPLLREAIARREHLPLVLRIAGDIGARELVPEFERLAADRDLAVAQAARDALRVLGTP
jgi:HEAT repeat protein